MKAILLIFLFLIKGTWAACLSGSLSVPADLNFDLKRAEEVVQEFEAAIRRDLPPQYNLVVDLQVLNDRVNAEILKKDNDILIQVMGGMLMHPKMKFNTLKLLLCHEIGHLLGGPPLKSRNGWSSTEGQADFYSAIACAKTLGLDEDSFLKAAVSLTTIYAEVTREKVPNLNSCDSTTVERTNYGYPSVQCRLDTLVKGWQGQERPACWYKP